MADETYATSDTLAYFTVDSDGYSQITMPMTNITYTTDENNIKMLKGTLSNSKDTLSNSITANLNQKENENKKGSYDMNNFSNLNNIFPNADFGPVNSDIVRLSPHGIAINANGKWQAYDTESDNIIDVTPMNFNCANVIYKMPVGINQIKVGDIILHAGKPMFVLKVMNEDEDEERKMRLTAIDIINAEEKTICPIKSVFGFNFYTKLVCLIDMVGGFQANEQNPFGNFLPWLLISDPDQKSNDILPFLLMSGQKLDMSNPLVIMALYGSDHNNLLPFILMTNASQAK